MGADCLEERIFISLGSNCSNAPEMLAKAMNGIGTLGGISIMARSSTYITEPQDYAHQPWFHNCALEIATAPPCSPEALLGKLLGLESRLGRTRSGGNRFGPRVIDIDLLLFGERTSSGFCELPHPRMLKRAFVLCPLHEIAPLLRIDGKLVGEWLAQLEYRLEGNTIWQSQGCL